MLKFLLIAFAPIFFPAPTSSFILAAAQACSAAIVYFKFTFRRVVMEHHLLLLTLCGLTSSLDSITSVLFNYSYSFIGEISALLLLVAPSMLTTLPI